MAEPTTSKTPPPSSTRAQSMRGKKADLLDAVTLLHIMEKLTTPEKQTFIKHLNERGFHLLCETVFNFCISPAQHAKYMSKSSLKEFKSNLKKANIDGKTARKFFKDLTNTKKEPAYRRKLLASQKGAGFGILSALIPVIGSVISSLIG